MSTSHYLVEWDSGNTFGPASQEHRNQYAKALQDGKQYFMYPYHGYSLKMIVSLGPQRVEKQSRYELTEPASG